MIPGPTQSGIPSNCNAYIVYDSVDRGKCHNLAALTGISLDDFLSWNPALGEKCSGLWLGQAYCVGVKGGTVASTTSSVSHHEGYQAPLAGQQRVHG